MSKILNPKLKFLDTPDETTRIAMGTGTFCVKNRHLIWAEQELLLELRADCGLWCVPGGRMKVGETVEQTVVRETLEETGIIIKTISIFGIYSDPKLGTVRHYTDDSYSQQAVDIFLLSEPIGGELAKSEESLDVAWFKMKNLPYNMVPTLRNATEDYRTDHRPILK
jgi:ADP-ribose pyrophosphatase YjhB (NUDIX family)